MQVISSYRPHKYKQVQVAFQTRFHSAQTNAQYQICNESLEPRAKKLCNAGQGQAPIHQPKESACCGTQVTA